MTTAAVPKEKLEKLMARWETIQAALAAGPDQDTFVKLSKEFAELDPVVAIIRQLGEAESELEGLRSIAADAGTDREMAELAQAEIPQVEDRLAELSHRIRVELLPRDAADEKSAIVELRAGTATARKRRCSRATCSACINATRAYAAGRCKSSRRAKPARAATGKWWPALPERAFSPG